MKQGITDAQKAIYRRQPHRVEWGVVVHRPRTIGDYTFVSLPGQDDHPVTQVTITPVAGDNFTNIKTNMTAWVGTGLGLSDLGKIRVRKGTVSSSKLLVAEAGSGLVNWTQATHLRVMDEFHPWIKHKKYNVSASQWRMDFSEAGGGQVNDAVAINIGPPIVGILDSGTGKYSASFYNDGYNWDYGISTQQWDFPDGAQVTSAIGTCDNPVIMTFNNASPGGSYFSLTITDASGASFIGRRLIYLLASKNQFKRVSVGGIQGGIESGGYTAKVTTYDEGGQDSMPDGAEIAIFESASYGNSAVAIGRNFAHRESVIFRGWLLDEKTDVGPFTTKTAFTAGTVGNLLQKSTGYDVFHSATCNGTSQWIEVDNLSLDRTAFNMLRWQSTLAEICDFYPASGFAVSPIAFQSLPRSSFWEQLKQNYGGKGMLGYFAADMQGGLHAFADTNITGGSNALPFGIDIGKQDRMGDVNIIKQHQDTVAQSQIFGVAYNPGGDTSHIPYGGESPGPPIGYEGGLVQHTRGLIAVSQDHMITWSGNHRAKLNADYPNVAVTYAGNYAMDVVPLHRQTITLSPADNSRDLLWVNKQFLAKNLGLEYDGKKQTVKANITLEEIVDGIGGSAYTFPTTIYPLPAFPPGLNPNIPNTDFNIDLNSGGGGDLTGLGFSKIYAMTYDMLSRTDDFYETSPTWSTDLGPGTNDNFQDRYVGFEIDPFNSDIALLSTFETVFKSTNMNSASPSWTCAITGDDIRLSQGTGWLSGEVTFGNQIQMHPVDSGYYVVPVVIMDNSRYRRRLLWAYSSDNGANWNVSNIIADYEDSASGNSKFLHAHSPRYAGLLKDRLLSGTILVGYVACIDKFNGNLLFKRTINGGQAWATVASIAGPISNQEFDPAGMHLQFDNDGAPSQDEIRISMRLRSASTTTGGAGGWEIHQAGDYGLSIVGHDPGANNDWPKSNTSVIWGLIPDHQDGTYGGDAYIGHSTIVKRSTDGGATFTQKDGTNIADSPFVGYSCFHPLRDNVIMAMTSCGIYVSIDNGNSFLNRTGDFAGTLSGVWTSHDDATASFDNDYVDGGSYQEYDQKRLFKITPVWNV